MPAPTARALTLRLVRRSRLGAFLGGFLSWSAIGYGLLGALVLLLRATHTLERFGPAGADWLPLLVPPLAALPFAVTRSARRALSEDAAAAWIDVSGGGGGWVVTGLERSDPRWDAAFAQAAARVGRLPDLRVGRELLLSVAGALFLAAALTVEIPERSPGPSPEFFEAAVATLAEKLEALQENVDLDEELAEDLAQRLGKLEELVGEEMKPESLFEALDALESRLGIESERVRSELESASRDLVVGVLDRMRDPEASMSALQRALDALKEAGVTENLPEGLEDLLGEGLQLPEGLDLSSAEFMELGRDLAQLMKGKLGALQAAGLLDARKLALAKEFRKLDELLEHECDEECDAEGG